MKKIINSKSLLALSLGVLTVGSLLLNSCSKKEECGATPAKPQTAVITQAQKDAALRFIQKMPAIRIQSGKSGFTLPKPNRDGSFNFADPSPGYNFSTSSNIQVVTDPTTGQSTVVLSTDGASAKGASAGQRPKGTSTGSGTVGG